MQRELPEQGQEQEQIPVASSLFPADAPSATQNVPLLEDPAVAGVEGRQEVVQAEAREAEVRPVSYITCEPRGASEISDNDEPEEASRFILGFEFKKRSDLTTD